jgi:hypothetical protein
MTTLIRPVSDAAAGTASDIAVAAFNDAEVLTALQNGSGNLELIGWHTSPTNIARGPEGDAGTVSEVALALVGRRAVTAVRSGSGRLLLISWDIPAGLTSITRLHDSGSAAGAATNITIVALDDTRLVTALRAGNGNLFLIAWRLEPDGTISRLGDAEAGELSFATPAVTLAALDSGNVVTAICNGSDNLELIGWSVSGDGNIERWGTGQSGASAGTVTDVALMPIASGGPANDIVTAVRDGADNLLVIAWRPDPSSGSFVRLGDSGGEAGSASGIALATSFSPAGTPTILVSVRRGSGNLGIIAFDFIVEGEAVAVIPRTGDYADPGSTNVSETHLAPLDAGRLLSAVSADGNLRLVDYAVAAAVTTFIRPVANASAGSGSDIAVGAISESELLTAVINGSGDLELLGWQTEPSTFTVSAAATATAGNAQFVALAIMGRRAVTLARDPKGNLRLSSWDVPPGLATIAHLADGHAGTIEGFDIAALDATLFVTAVGAGNGQLLLISWNLNADGSFSRLQEIRGGQVSIVTIAAIDGGNVVTAVRNDDGNLELTGWSVSADGTFDNWGDSGSQAGEVSDIAILAVAGPNPSSDIVTAVRDGSSNLLLILWRPSSQAGTIRRLADSGSEAGTASSLAVTATVTAGGTPTLVVSMRNGNGSLELIAFETFTGSGGVPVIIRTGAYTSRGDEQVDQTSLATLGPGRIASALDFDGSLVVTTYNILDAATIAAPATILQIQYQNPDLSLTNTPDWASTSGGNTFPTDVDREWQQVFAPAEDYDDNVVGCAGWVIAPDDSDADLPFSHPFGFDWEFSVAVDDDANGYTSLLSPGSGVDHEGDPSQDVFALAASLGLFPSGLLGLESESGLVPRSFRAQVNHGDRVAAFGRWILDTGHDFGGYYRTEIHPPLLLATASVQSVPGALAFTRALFTSRPYLSSQLFTQNPADAYYDAAADDGTFFDHLEREIKRVLEAKSRRVEAHLKIKSLPFRGTHTFTILVRPPPAPPSGPQQLVVSFGFTVRTGCTVAVAAASNDTVAVSVTLDDTIYAPARLPQRSAVTYSRERLSELDSSLGYQILEIDALAGVLPAVLGPAYVEYVLHRGVLTDGYAAATEVDVRNADNAVLNALAADIPTGAGVVVDNDQPYPMYGWLEARWEATVIEKRPQT